MKMYNVKCPACGRINHNLFLEETEGCMECEYCSRVVRSEDFDSKERQLLISQRMQGYSRGEYRQVIPVVGFVSV